MLKRLDDLGAATKSNAMLSKTKEYLRESKVPNVAEINAGLDEIQQLSYDAGYRRALLDGPLREDMGR